MAKNLLLNRAESIILKPKPPYNFDATVFKPSHYPDPTKVYKPGKYWFAMGLHDKIYGVRMNNLGSVNKPKVRITIFYKSSLPKNEMKDIIGELSFRFEFGRDISRFYRNFRNDRVLAPFLKRWHGMHNSCAQSLYGLLMICILLQNTVIRRSIQMTKDMLEKYGIKVKFDGKEVYEFWKPEKMAEVSEEELRKLKVGYRARLFIKLSRTFVEEGIDEFELRKLTAEEAKKGLIRLYGVGPETARISLVEALHHYDIFEHVAPWQQKILSRLLFNKKLVPAEKIIRYVKTRWKEWSALAVHYIWEDIFWQREHKHIAWLKREIRR